MDIRDPAYQRQHPELRDAMEFVAKLDMENFMRFVRLTIEMRELAHQAAHKEVSAHFRRLSSEQQS